MRLYMNIRRKKRKRKKKKKEKTKRHKKVKETRLGQSEDEFLHPADVYLGRDEVTQAV